MWTRPELSYIVNGSVKCIITLGNNLAVSSIVKHILTKDAEIPLQGKCTVCKSTIRHPKSLVVYGAFGEVEGCGHERGDCGVKSSPVAAGVGGPRLG